GPPATRRRGGRCAPIAIEISSSPSRPRRARRSGRRGRHPGATPPSRRPGATTKPRSPRSVTEASGNELLDQMLEAGLFAGSWAFFFPWRLRRFFFAQIDDDMELSEEAAWAGGANSTNA